MFRYCGNQSYNNTGTNLIFNAKRTIAIYSLLQQVYQNLPFLKEKKPSEIYLLTDTAMR